MTETNDEFANRMRARRGEAPLPVKVHILNLTTVEEVANAVHKVLDPTSHIRTPNQVVDWLRGQPGVQSAGVAYRDYNQETGETFVKIKVRVDGAEESYAVQLMSRNQGVWEVMGYGSSKT